MRWADLDSLNHVNNVVYLDYAAESRAILIEDGVVGADERVQRMAVVEVKRGKATFEPFPLRLRHSDVDASGFASLTKAFEFFQEARIVLFTSIRRDGSGASRFVVGHVDVTFGEPMPWRREPYPVTSWISRIGDSSIHIEAEIAEGDHLYAHARSVLVGFDMVTQASRKLEDQEKELLSEFIPKL